MVRSFKRNLRKSNGSRKMRRGSNNGPSFAAKLAAFILEGLKTPPKLDDDDSHLPPEVSGALPYLHMNIQESDVKDKFKETETQRVSGLETLCKTNKLEQTLVNVKFNCHNQSTNGVQSINNAIIDSINNRWAMRTNGRKHLDAIHVYMKKQLDAGIIDKSSLKWAKGLPKFMNNTPLKRYR